ncbi:DUF2786 domain-containing protein [Lentzea indica]|uniref:DUF2786 domain-containing protein n=1 Tax=Lentzea indica TaxID=2604800 RepID=UPI001CB6C14F
MWTRRCWRACEPCWPRRSPLSSPEEAEALSAKAQELRNRHAFDVPSLTLTRTGSRRRARLGCGLTRPMSMPSRIWSPQSLERTGAGRCSTAGWGSSHWSASRWT